jgi:hypothetical protein
MTIKNQEALQERARVMYTVPTEISADDYLSLGRFQDYYDLDEASGRYVLKTSLYVPNAAVRYGILQHLGVHNGIRMVVVTALDTGSDQATLNVHFFNRNGFGPIGDYAIDADTARQLFPITGGHRIRAGDASGQVQTIAVDNGDREGTDEEGAVLTLTVAPIGDYSTYTLSLDTSVETEPDIDPLFGAIDFKFRPRCFSIECAPQWEPGSKPQKIPAIDYLAKDYESFKHTMIAAMMQRVPDWQPTSEADLDMVLLELFSAAADELSDFQDRVMNEAYLTSARKRVSLARHARLMDYHIHQGNQAGTWLALKLNPGETVAVPKKDLEDEPIPLTVWAGPEDYEVPGAIVFIAREEGQLESRVNQLGLYTWSGSVPALAAGSTTADVQPLIEDADSPGRYAPDDDEADAADELESLIQEGTIRYLLIQEHLNPGTGRVAGRDPGKRQILELLPGQDGAEAIEDPVTGAYFVRIRWRRRDALKGDYCFTVECPDDDGIYYPCDHVSLFHGNLIQVFHGRLVETVFKDPDDPILEEGEYHYEHTERGDILCRLPAGTLAYRDTLPGGDVPPKSTMAVQVVAGDISDTWDEVVSLVYSDDSSERGDHFVVETDEQGWSLLRFGNGVNGRKLPQDAEVHCTYQIGWGPDGNIGFDKIRFWNAAEYPEIADCWNPFEITGGRAPEPMQEIIRRVPEAYRARQLRAITPQDYVDRVEELEAVSRAAARYAWTGSWRTVQIAVDPAGADELSPDLASEVSRHLEAVRLIGEDLEIRAPHYVPLDVFIALCVHPDYWVDDIRYILEQELSDSYTPDGRKGFFHPDCWTFGQKLQASQIIGRIQQIKGVDHVRQVTLKRWNEPSPGTDAIAEVAANEIIRVRNDPDHMEEGFITWDLGGGRQ